MGKATDLVTSVLSLLTIDFLIIQDSVNGQQEQGIAEDSIGGFIALGCVAGFILLVSALSTMCYLVRRSRQLKYEELRQNKLETQTLVNAKTGPFLSDYPVQHSFTGLSDGTRPARKDKSYPVKVTREFDEICKPLDNQAQQWSVNHTSPLLEDRPHGTYHRSEVASEPYIYPLDEGSDEHSRISCSKKIKDKFNRHIPDIVHSNCSQINNYDHHSDTSQFSYFEKDYINEKHYLTGIETTCRSYEPAYLDPFNQCSFERLSDSIDYSDSISERCKSPSPNVPNMLYSKNPKLRNQSGQSPRRDIKETKSAGYFGSSVYSVGGAPQSYYIYPPKNYYMFKKPSTGPAGSQTEMSMHQEEPQHHQLSWRQEHQRAIVRSSPPLMRSANGGQSYVMNWRDSWPNGRANNANAQLSSYRPKVLQTITPAAAYAPTPLAVVGQPPQNISARPTAVIMPLGGSQFRMVKESQAYPREKVISSVSPPRKKGLKSSRNKLTDKHVYDQRMQLQNINPRPHNATHIWREVQEMGRNYADSRYSNGRQYGTSTDSLDFTNEHAGTAYILANTRQTGTNNSGALNSKINDEVVIIDYVSQTGVEPPPSTLSSGDRYSGLHNNFSQHNSDSNLDSQFDGGRRRQRDPDYGSFEMLPRERYLS